MRALSLALAAAMLALALSSCQASLTKDQVFRIESLYEHTILMRDLSDPFVLQMVKLDASAISEERAAGPIDKLAQLESSMGVNAEGRYEDRIQALEIRMNDMMKEWARYNKN